jgi:integrase
VSTLAGFSFDPPPYFQAESNSPSPEYARLLWNGLDPATRKGYKSAIKSYETLCALNNDVAWPATEVVLGKWITARAFGSSTLQNMGRIKPDTIQVYLAALRSYHTDRLLNSDVFDSVHIKRLIKGARNVFPPTPKRPRHPITLAILKGILPSLSDNKDEANIHAAFCIAFAGFLRMGEFTNTATDLAAPGASPQVLRRSDISFSENYDTATLLLRRSKTDVNNTGVRIIIARTKGITCPVASLLHLLAIDPQDQSDTLFRFSNGPFTRARVLSALSLGLLTLGIQDSGYSGHSFRRGAAQHASDMGMLDSEIQTLGRWSSAAFQLYFTLSPLRLRQLNFQFQTGTLLSSN